MGRFQLDLHSNNMQALFIASQTPWGNEKFSSKEKLSSANTSEKQKLKCSVLHLPEALRFVQPPALKMLVVCKEWCGEEGREEMQNQKLSCTQN